MVQPGPQGTLKTEPGHVFKGFYEGFLDHILHIGVVSKEIPAGADKGLLVGLVEVPKSRFFPGQDSVDQLFFSQRQDIPR